jgi:RNA polymerase sigma-70 factor (ECF subfamily)
MIAIARGIDRFDGRAAFSTWCHRVATNAALDELRRRRRRPVPVHPDGPQPVAPGPAIEDRVGARLDVDAALRTLPDDFRVAVVLRDLCDLDYAEIAEVLDVPPGTVRSRISRGRALLVERLDPQAERAPGAGPPGSGNCVPSPVRQNDDG